MIRTLPRTRCAAFAPSAVVHSWTVLFSAFWVTFLRFQYTHRPGGIAGCDAASAAVSLASRWTVSAPSGFAPPGASACAVTTPAATATTAAATPAAVTGRHTRRGAGRQ